MKNYSDNLDVYFGKFHEIFSMLWGCLSFNVKYWTCLVRCLSFCFHIADLITLSFYEFVLLMISFNNRPY
jgi:hypothetical protein